MDECQGSGGFCEQNCHNVIGSFRCTCRKGFILDGNRRTCSGMTQFDNRATSTLALYDINIIDIDIDIVIVIVIIIIIIIIIKSYISITH